MTDFNKGDGSRKQNDSRPFLKVGLSMAAVKNFDDTQKTREIKIKKPRRNIKKQSVIIF